MLTDVELLGPARIRRLAEQLGIRPTKSLGQNFVIDANTVRRIVREARLDPQDVVLEVGPGLGSLTLALLEQVAAVVAVEIDPVLAQALPGTVAEQAPGRAAALTVIQQDALKVTALPGPAPSALVANLPYNVAVPVLLTLLARFGSLVHGLVMVQAEVAERLAARPGEQAYGVPSAKAAWYADVRRAGPVPRAVFWPVPGVDSGLVAFTRREPPAPEELRERSFSLVDAAFAQRRKMLRSALSGRAGSSTAAGALLAAAGVDPTRRGEQLGIADFARIAQVEADQEAAGRRTAGPDEPARRGD